MASKEFSEDTLEFCKTTSKKVKQELGQYPTPYNIVDKLFDGIELKDNMKVLESSFGTCQIIDKIEEKGFNIKVDGYEIDEKLVEKANKKYKGNNYNLKCKNFLEEEIKEEYDFIPGNPPYFQLKTEDRKKYQKMEMFKDIAKGKADIFGLFLKKSLDLLKEGGILSYIIPVSFLNGRTHEPLRKYIAENFNILSIEIINKHEFIDTQYEVMIIKIKKEKNNGKYVVRKDVIKKEQLTIFSLDWKEVQEKINNWYNIKELGGKVITGPFVWNQNKDKLQITKGKNKAVPIIYSQNMVDGKIKLLDKALNKKGDKKQYVKRKIVKDKMDSSKDTIVINRIVGAKNIKLNCVYIEKGFEYIGENHINIIKHHDEKVLNEIYEKLQDPTTLNHVKSIRGNVQLSQSDLENLIPIREKETQKKSMTREEFINIYIKEEMVDEFVKIDIETLEKILKT